MSGAIPFSRYYDWAGVCREISAANAGVLAVAYEQMASGAALATNAFELWCVRMPRACHIEARCFAESVGAYDASVVFEWHQDDAAAGGTSLLAWARMRLSAVSVRANASVSRASRARHYLDFMRRMTPVNAARPIEPPPANVGVGHVLQRFHGLPNDDVPCQQVVFATSLEDSNLVGNIYYARYGSWQAVVRDAFFHRVASACRLRSRGIDGELYGVQSTTTQLRNVMPFETVQVRLAVRALYDRAIDFGLTYWRVADDGSLTKVAAGTHRAVWTIARPGEAIVARPWPDDIRQALLAAVSQGDTQAGVVARA